MKKTLLAIACLAAAPILLATGPKPPAKATGGVRFTAAGQPMALSFNAHAPVGNRPAKGNLNLRRITPGGHADCVIRVTNVTISGKVATICGQVTADDIAANRGRWVSIVVVDGGTPGRNGDQVGLTWAASLQTARNVAFQTSRRAVSLQHAANTTAWVPGLSPVTAGNLQVR